MREYSTHRIKVRNIEAVLEELKGKGLKLVDEKPRIGVGGAKIAFIHLKGTGNVLAELCGKPWWADQACQRR